MAAKKRRHEEDAVAATAGDESVHPARKRRLAYSDADASLAQIFNNLRDELPAVRSEATIQLLKNLVAAESPDRQRRIDSAVTRLIKGGCSGAKAARVGFSMGLAEVLRLGFGLSAKAGGEGLSVEGVVGKIGALSTVDGKVSGEERRNALLGRCFALQAVLQSGVLGNVGEGEVRVVFDAVADLAAEKAWLRTECGAVLRSYLVDGEAPPGDEVVRILVDSLTEKGLIKSPEGVALWLIIKKHFPQVKLPKGCWHHSNPLASQERAALTKILLKNEAEAEQETNGASKKSGARQSKPSFAWDTILAYLGEADDLRRFTGFWTDCVALPTFSATSSTERKAVGLQLFSQAIKKLPVSLLQETIHPNIVRCIVDQRAKPDRLLFEAAKLPLNQLAARAKEDPSAAAEIACKLVRLLPGNLDKTTKSTLENVLSAVDAPHLKLVGEVITLLCWDPELNDEKDADKKRRLLADLLLHIVRARRANQDDLFAKSKDGGESARSLQKWLRSLLKDLVALGYSKGSNASLPESIRTVFRERLMSVLVETLTHPLDLAVLAPKQVVRELHSLKDDLVIDLSADKAGKSVKQAYKLVKNDSTKREHQLLLSLGILQVYRQEPDGADVLTEIITCVESDVTSDSSATLVELLLSFVTKGSALFRRLAEMVFSAFAPEVDRTGVESMIDILLQDESLAGQQELFQDDAEAVAGMDVDEEDSDVEIVGGMLMGNGAESDNSDDTDEDDSSDDASGWGSAAADDDNELNRLQTILRAAQPTNDDSGDESDMNSEQMFEWEDKYITQKFAAHAKTTNRKQQNKDAKENIVNFKNRVLDLLEIYVKSQYANGLALDLILPLVTLTRTTTSPPTAKKALDVLERYFDACKRHKALPQPADGAEGCFAILEAVHAEIRLGGSKVHASACSRASQFLAKVLVAMDAEHFVRIDGMYTQLRFAWRREAKSKIHVAVLNDWHSWSLQR